MNTALKVGMVAMEWVGKLSVSVAILAGIGWIALTLWLGHPPHALEFKVKN